VGGYTDTPTYFKLISDVAGTPVLVYKIKVSGSFQLDLGGAFASDLGKSLTGRVEATSAEGALAMSVANIGGA